MRGWSRRGFLAAGLVLGGQGLLQACGVRRLAHTSSDTADWQGAGLRGVARAAAWCRSQQRPDGRFVSSTYGLLRGGASLTPFVLLALQRAGQLDPEQADRALAALLSMRSEPGALGLGGPAADYPCYATGMLLSALGRIRGEDARQAAAPSVDWLRTQQFRSDAGWRGHPAQGGWGMGAPEPLRPPHAGHVDLSMTRRVVEGLRDAGVAVSDPCLVEARDFVLRCQSTDGGCFYSPVEQALNKGRRQADGSPGGYGSATTDGVLCMEALGLGGSEAAGRARAWLLDHHRLDANPGLEGGPRQAFATAMRGYYRAGAAECFARVSGPPGWRPALVRAVLAEQRQDGSFRNQNALQKEDDPLIASGFALLALAPALGR